MSARSAAARVVPAVAAVLLAVLAPVSPAAAEPVLYRGGGPLPNEAFGTQNCVYFRGVELEWVSGLPAPEASSGNEAESATDAILSFGDVEALRYRGSPPRLQSAAYGSVHEFAVEQAGPDRVVVDFRIEVDHGCIAELKRYPLTRVDEAAPRIARLQLVERMTQAIVDAQRAREDIDHAGSARAWARALDARDKLGLARDLVSLQIDQQRIQSWAIASLPVPVEDAQRLVDESTATLGPSHEVTANTYTALAWTLRKHGRHREAIAAFRRAYELTAASQGPTFRATLRLQQAMADELAAAGLRGEAIAFAEGAYRQRVELLGPDNEETWRALAQLVALYTQVGRGDEVEPLARQGYERNRATLGETHRMTAYSLAVLGRALRGARRYEEALPLLEREHAQRVDLYGPDDPATVATLVDLADTQLRVHRIDAARATAQRAVEAVAASPRRRPPSDSLMLLQARISAAAGDVDSARAQYTRLVADFEERFGQASPYSLDARFESASVTAAAGDYASAYALYSDGIATLERVRAEGGMSVESRQALLISYADAYRRTAAVAFRLHRNDEVLRMTELSKARSLLDTLTQRRAEASAGLAPEDQARFTELAERINALQAQGLAARDDAIQRAALEVRRSELSRELSELQADLMRRSPTYARLSAVRLIDSPQRASAILPPDTVFVSYVVVPADPFRAGAAPSLLALVMSRSRPLVVVELGSAEGMEELAMRYRASLGADGRPGRGPDGSGESAVANQIAGRWLAPLRSALTGHRHLVIAPDGALATLPFETLPWGDRRLIDAFDVSYAQSLSVYALVRGRASSRSHAPHKLLAIGAPQFGTLATTPAEATRGVAVTGSARRAMSRLNADWAPLPGAMRELRSVAAVFGPERSEVVSGADATEDMLDGRNRSGDLRRFRYLLFATHGMLDPEEPALSAIVLGRASPTSGYDGYVTALEWLDYRVQSDLIVLSACSTGEGRIVMGEGVLGLPYAMFVAGNRNAILTLWAVPDASTGEFIIRFFAQVRAGKSHAEALAVVKRRFARSGRYRAPVYWAGFVLYGS
nr:CHAT domain-containing tetratricopeptide repeat protein [Caldimonas sp.]